MTTTTRAAPTRSGVGSATLPGQTAILLALALLLAVGLRLLLAARSGLWRDEALFLFVARSPTAGALLDFLRGHESHPPLFYFLMRMWLAVWGDSEAAALALPVLLGVALVPAMYLVGSRMFSRRTGLIAAALAAASPTLSLHSALVRPYSLLPLLCLLSIYFLWRGLEGGVQRAWALHAAFTLGLLLTHNWGWLVYAGQAVMAAVLIALPGGRPRMALVRPWVLAQLGVLAAYAPWIPALLFQIEHAGHGPAPVSAPGAALLAFARTTLLFPGTQVDVTSENTWPLSGAFAGALLLLLMVLAFRRVLRPAGQPAGAGGQRAALLLLAGVPLVAVGVAIALSAKSYLLPPRCLATVVPCVLLAAAHGIASLAAPARPLVPVTAIAALVAVSLASSLAQINDIKSNARQVAEAVAAATRPTDLIVISPEWIASSFNYYYKPDNPQICYPHLGREGAVPFNDQRERFLDPEAYRRARARLEEARRAGGRGGLIMDRDHLIDLDNRLLDREVLPETILSAGFVGMIRTNQLRKHLTELYGPPDTGVVPPDRRLGDEIFVALLFDAPAG